MKYFAKWVAVALVMFAISFVCIAAFAHDHNRPDLTPWFQELRNKSNTQCCDGKDGDSLDDPDWEADGKHYRVRLDGQWYDVPDNAVVTAPNKVGHAVVWKFKYNGWGSGSGTAWTIRCFMPGVLT